MVGVMYGLDMQFNVVSKTGKREVVVGPQTRLLETMMKLLKAMELSTGLP